MPIPPRTRRRARRTTRRDPMADRNPSGGSPLLALLILALAFATMLLAGCTVGPDYKRPDLDLPKEYGIAQASVPAPERWWGVFNDPVLDGLVDEALARRADVTERTRVTRAKAFELQKMRLDAGVVSELEYRQVESDLRTTEALVPVLRLARVRQEGTLALLFGRSPRGVYEARVDLGTPVTPLVVEVPAGVPSDLLLR